jgi:very-short-patch-repair endonuclease
LIHGEQAAACGLSRAAIGRRVSSGRWRKVLPNVYLVSGSAATWKTWLLAAVLWAGGDAVVSHRAAARLWGFPGFEKAPIEISSSRRLRQRKVVAHRITDLARSDRARISGIPVTSVHRTLIDLGDVATPEQVEDALDDAVRRGMTSADWLRKQLQRIGTNGRKGATVLRELISDDERPSWLERRFIRLLGTTEMQPFRREYEVLSRYFIDFAWPEALLGVEVHGEKYHRKRWLRDWRRHNEITSSGWTILHFTWPEIRDEPERVIAEIVSTYRRLVGLDISSR